jgi:phosphoribosyl 1,2-cyclic phosphodiesterase
MVKFCVLASGSSGNSAFLSTSRTRILIDAGLSLRELAKRLQSIEESHDQLDAILVTHEHSDHVSGLLRLMRACLKAKRRVPVYLTRLTAPEIDWEDIEAPVELFQAGTRFQVGDIEVESFSIPHDASDPVGFCFRGEGIRIGMATDLGYLPDSIRYHLRGVDVLLLESNHDIEMLKVGPYPWVVKQRVMGRRGHLSNDMVCDYLAHDFDRATAAVVLGHLSEHNNHPEIVRMGAAAVLEGRAHAAKLVIAEQSRPSEVFAF